MRTNRRTVLAGTASAIALSGCLNRGGGGNDGPEGATEVTDRVDADIPPQALSSTAKTGGPLVEYMRAQDETATLVTDGTEVQDAVDAFVEETDFEHEALVLVQSVAPQTCYETRVEDFAISDGVLSANATTPRTAGEDEMCGDAISTPTTTLIRVSFDSEPPEDCVVIIEDGMGETRSVRD